MHRKGRDRENATEKSLTQYFATRCRDFEQNFKRISRPNGKVLDPKLDSDLDVIKLYLRRSDRSSILATDPNRIDLFETKIESGSKNIFRT